MCPFDYSFTPPRGPARGTAGALGREALAIIREGGYVAPSGRRVELADRIARAVRAARDYLPHEVVALPARVAEAGNAAVVEAPRRTTVSVVNGTSLSSARGLCRARDGAEPLVLNFASAKNPGGGFLGGALAQEESLARSSALFATIENSAMYPHHRAQHDCLYTSFMIHSPHVPVFRDDETGELLEEAYDCAFLTAPAPNAGVVLERDPSRADEVREAMAERVSRALAIAAVNGHRCLVLGAWGCGVFKNEPEHVAGCFARELAGPFAGVFDEIVFAVLDSSPERRFVRPFVERFGT